MSYYYDVLFQLFRLILALTAYTAIMYDNYRHRDLKMVAYAYTFLVLSTTASILSNYFNFIGNMVARDLFNYLTSVFGVLVAGMLFFLTSYYAHQKMIRVEEETKLAFKSP